MGAGHFQNRPPGSIQHRPESQPRQRIGALQTSAGKIFGAAQPGAELTGFPPCDTEELDLCREGLIDGGLQTDFTETHCEGRHGRDKPRRGQQNRNAAHCHVYFLPFPEPGTLTIQNSVRSGSLFILLIYIVKAAILAGFAISCIRRTT